MRDITIIVPFYNVQDYIAECLESIIRQTYEPKEVLLINDGSTDRSRKICQSYVEEYGYMKLLDQKNQGISTARNKGLDHATGDYVIFLDSDDFIADNMLSVLIKKAKETDSDIVQCGLYYYFDRNRVKKYFRLINNDVVLKEKKAFFQAMFDKKLMSYLCTAIYKKNLFDDLRFQENRIMEDTFIKPFLLMRSNRISIIPDCLYFYRQRVGSVMHTFDSRHFDIIDSINQLKTILIDNDMYRYFHKEMILWYGYHLMIMIKHMAKYNNYIKYKSYVKELNSRISKELTYDTIGQIKEIMQDIESNEETYHEASKIFAVLSYYLNNNNLFWLKVKYNSFRKKYKYGK